MAGIRPEIDLRASNLGVSGISCNHEIYVNLLVQATLINAFILLGNQRHLFLIYAHTFYT